MGTQISLALLLFYEAVPELNYWLIIPSLPPTHSSDILWYACTSEMAGSRLKLRQSSSFPQVSMQSYVHVKARQMGLIEAPGAQRQQVH